MGLSGVRSGRGLPLALFAVAVLIGGCTRHQEVAESYAPPPPPPAPRQEPVLAGAPAPTPQSQAEAAWADRQARDDVWLSHLPPGVMARRVIDPRTGRSLWIISNAPIDNPVEPTHRWRSHYHHPRLAGAGRHAEPTVVTSTSGGGALTGPAAQPAAPAPVPMARPAPKAVPAAPAPRDTTPAAAPATPSAPFVMTPMIWLIGGIALLVILLLTLLGGRRNKRRSGHAPAH